MTSKTLSVGMCALCGDILSKGKMARHLELCMREHEALETPVGKRESSGVSLLHLVIEGEDDKE